MFAKTNAGRASILKILKCHFKLSCWNFLCEQNPNTSFSL